MMKRTYRIHEDVDEDRSAGFERKSPNQIPQIHPSDQSEIGLQDDDHQDSSRSFDPRDYQRVLPRLKIKGIKKPMNPFMRVDEDLVHQESNEQTQVEDLDHQPPFFLKSDQFSKDTFEDLVSKDDDHLQNLRSDEMKIFESSESLNQSIKIKNYRSIQVRVEMSFDSVSSD